MNRNPNRITGAAIAPNPMLYGPKAAPLRLAAVGCWFAAHVTALLLNAWILSRRNGIQRTGLYAGPQHELKLLTTVRACIKPHVSGCTDKRKTMSNKIRKNIAAMMAMTALAFEGGRNSMLFSGNGDRAFAYIDGEKIEINKKPIIPNGCKVYHFDEVGNCLYDVEHETSVFNCIAINEKSAIKKFNKWLAAEIKRSVV